MKSGFKNNCQKCLEIDPIFEKFIQGKSSYVYLYSYERAMVCVENLSNMYNWDLIVSEILI